MTEETQTTWNPMKLLGVIIPKIPGLLLRSGGELIRFRSKARKASRIFHDELLQQGLDPVAAEGLTKDYLDGSSPLLLLRRRR